MATGKLKGFAKRAGKNRRTKYFCKKLTGA
jgi:hypothetical protein